MRLRWVPRRDAAELRVAEAEQGLSEAVAAAKPARRSVAAVGPPWLTMRATRVRRSAESCADTLVGSTTFLPTKLVAFAAGARRGATAAGPPSMAHT